MHIVTCSNYFDSNRTAALRTGVCEKKIDFLVNFHTDFRVICPFRLYKIFQCWIIQEKLFLALDLDHENNKINACKSINLLLYRCMGVIIDREERYAAR